MTFECAEPGATGARPSAEAARVPREESPRTTPSVVQVDRALDALAMSGVHVASRVISDVHIPALHAVELAAVARSVATRQAEFATGRALLRSLLGEDVPIPIAPDRAPVLPVGVHASLAHDGRFAVAALSRSATVRSIGIDIEPMTRLSAEMAAVIVRADEGSIDAHLAFTLKEAAYKAWSRLGGRMLDFHEVRLDVGADSFEAEVLPTGTRLHGRYIDVGDRWISLVVVSLVSEPTAQERGGSPLGR